MSTPLDPHEVMQAIDSCAGRLDDLHKLAAATAKVLNEAEERWEEVYDQVAEDLKDEMADEGRKGDPAEHTIVSTARRQHRAVYTNWRRAKRAGEMLDRQLKATTAAMNGRQSELSALRDEARAPVPHPHWSGPRAA